MLVDEDGLTYPAIDAIWVGLEYGRVFFRKDENRPACRSIDGIMPIESGEFTGPCTECPNAQWNYGERPGCDEVFTMLLLTQPENEPIALQVKGLGIRNLGKLKSRLQVYSGRPIIRIEGKRIEQAGKRAFYLPKFTILPGAEWATGQGNALDLIAQPQTTPVHAIVAPQAETHHIPQAAPAPETPPWLDGSAPDMTQVGWEGLPVPLAAAKGKTWRELAAIGTGRVWLTKLAASTSRPDLAECAAAMLGLAAGIDGEIPF
jgi:hypothetical protein